MGQHSTKYLLIQSIQDTEVAQTSSLLPQDVNENEASENKEIGVAAYVEHPKKEPKTTDSFALVIRLG